MNTILTGAATLVKVCEENGIRGCAVAILKNGALI